VVVVAAVVAVGIVGAERAGRRRVLGVVGTVDLVVVVDELEVEGGTVGSGDTGGPVDGGAVVGAGAGTDIGAGTDTAGSGRTSTYTPSVPTNATVRTAVERRTRSPIRRSSPRDASRGPAPS
jgi:hypothetical protein